MTGALWLIPAVLLAQAAATANATGGTDGDWQKLQAQLAQLARPASAPGNATAAEHARVQRVADLLGAADAFKAFYTGNPSGANAAEARRQETLTLIQAWAAGDSTQDTRRQQLVAAIRQDGTYSSRQRFEVAGLADNVAVDRQQSLGRPARLAAFEQVARNLAKEFPDVPAAYEGLVEVAKDAPDAQAAAIAHDVLAMSGASDTTKTQAQIILDRQALVGTPLDAITTPVLGAGNGIEKAAGNPVILYTWATWSRRSIALAKTIAAHAPAGAVIIGVCLDGPDLAAARAVVASQQLPGQQEYDVMGVRGKLSGRLRLFEPGIVYLADARGVIRSVSAQHDLSSALSSL